MAISKVKLPDNTVQPIKDNVTPRMYLGTCPTAAATVTKVVTVEDFPLDSNGEPLVGTFIGVKFTNTNSATAPKLNVNEIGAKSIYYNSAEATSTSSVYGGSASRYTYYVWDGTYWVWVTHGTDNNDNTLAYNVRYNSASKTTIDKFARYRILFTSANDAHWVPANTSTSTNATASRTVNQTPINPFGQIVYYGSTTSISADGTPSATVLYTQYALTFGYSFNRTGAALTLTTKAPVYIKCAPQSNGSAIIDADTPYVQALPSTEDGKIYIYLGVASSATAVEMSIVHPVYYYKDGVIRPWTNAADSNSHHTYTVSDFSSIPDSILSSLEVGDTVIEDLYIIGSSGKITGIVTNCDDGSVGILSIDSVTAGNSFYNYTFDSTEETWSCTYHTFYLDSFGNKIINGTDGHFVGLDSNEYIDSGYGPSSFATSTQGTKADNAVQYVSQTLTDAQKTQARSNIGAGTYTKPSTGIPASDLEAGVIPTVPTDIVKYTAQTLTNAQKAQARSNIGAVADKTLILSDVPAEGDYDIPNGDIWPYGDANELEEAFQGKFDFVYIYKEGYYDEVSGVNYFDEYVLSPIILHITPDEGSGELYFEVLNPITAKTVICRIDRGPTGYITVWYADSAPTDVVKYTAQSLNDSQKAQARTNIGATAPEVFWAEYRVTTLQQITDAFNGGYYVVCKYQDKFYTLSSLTATYCYFTAVNNTAYYRLLLNGSTWSAGQGSLEVTSGKVTSLSSSSTDTQYPSAKATYDEIHPAVQSTQPQGGFLPNVEYNLGTLTGNVTFALASAVSGITNHYFWSFDTGSTAPTVAWPVGIIWSGGSAPTVNADKHYEISVLNNIGVAMETDPLVITILGSTTANTKTYRFDNGMTWADWVASGYNVDGFWIYTYGTSSRVLDSLNCPIFNTATDVEVNTTDLITASIVYDKGSQIFIIDDE